MRRVAALAALSAFSSAFGQVKVTQIDYHGWANCYRISNGAVDVVVVPQVGRVMRYGYVGQANMLWENAALAGKLPAPGVWNNYGGDKVWPAPQKDWNWPPDPLIDGSAWTAEVLPDGVRMTSPDGGKSKLRFVREITMGDLGTEVRFHNLMTNLGARRLVGPWQITQVDDPFSVFLATLPTTQMPDGWRLLTGSRIDPAVHQIVAGGLRLSLSNVSYKFGAFSASGEITSSKGNTILHVQTKTYDGANYPDGGSATEVYLSSGSDRYAELELLAPLTRMENGEASVLDTTWRLTQAN